MTEHYLIPNFWKYAEKQKRREAEINSPDVEEYLRRPREMARHSPLSIAYPVDLTVTTEVLLPETWNIKPEQTDVDDPAFEFKRSISTNSKLLVFIDRFRSRLDHIMPSDIARYAANLDRARTAVSYELYKYDQAPRTARQSIMDRFNWSVATIALLSLLFFIWLATRLYRYDPPSPAALADAKLAGIGGWLILPAISVVALPIRLLADLVKTLPSFAADTWSTLTTVGNAAYHPMWTPVLLYELSANLAQIVFSVLLAVLFFKKRRSVPYVFIGIIGGSAIIQAADLMLTNAIPAAAHALTPNDWVGLARSVMGLAIWGTYFLVSRRVKSTFVNVRNTHD